MPDSKLPERASLEYLKKLAKDRLQELRKTDPHAKLASALLAVAREHGFSSWRALKAEIDKRHESNIAVFFAACGKGDVTELRRLLASDRSLAHAARPHPVFRGWTGLHSAAQGGQLEAVRLLLDHGADPNARESGDNTYPLHWAAAGRYLDVVRALLDAGGDPHGIGDVHGLDAIGWATYYHPHDGQAGDKPEVAALLVERGARHHIFSAISLADPDLIRTLVEQSPDALDRRMSRFEKGRTPLHLATDLKRYEILDLLIELGADIEAEDGTRQTPMAVAMLRGDQEAIRRLHTAGAKQPQPVDTSSYKAKVAKIAESVKKGVPSMNVPDIAAALDWYTSIGFKELGRYEDDGVVNWGMTSFGRAELMLGMRGAAQQRQDVSFWFYMDSVDELYQLMKSRQLEAAKAALAGETAKQAGFEFTEDIYDPFYGGRQFSIRDLNGYTLIFYAPE